MQIGAPAAQADNPLQLLRDAIDLLKSSNGDFPDQTEVADLLAEAREALERANVISRALTECDGFLKETRFEQAFAALDEGLQLYPAEAALVRRRREVEEQHKAFSSATAARMAIEEAQWLLDLDRIDLAVNFLRNKAAELPAQPALMARLEELERLLPEWEQKRYVQITLERGAALEQHQQWQAALTILEEALQSYPESTELTGAANRVRDWLADHERKKKLTRRLELIGQRIAAQSWRQAFNLLEDTRRDFPGTPELEPLQSEVETGLSRSECETVVAEVRQCLADGELEQAETVLLKGLESLGPEPTLEALCDELESVRKYRKELHTAQVLFGQRRLEEAESVLAQLVAPDRPEAKALLDAVREARIAAEEENFWESGREKALELIRQGQFAQAADLLRNLLSLNPGNPILEKDLMVAQSGLDQAPPTESQPATQPRVGITWVDAAPAGESALSRFRRALIAGIGLLVLVSVTGAAWKLARNGAPISRPAAPPAAVELPTERLLPVALSAATTDATPPAEAPGDTESTASSNGNTSLQPLPATALRQFIPVDTRQPRVQNQDSPLPPPAAPPTSVTSSPASTPNAAAPAPAGKFQEAQLVERPMPGYPPLARRANAFGAVRLEALIDEHGVVTNVKSLSGHPILAAAARNAVLKWKYKAATLNGQPVATTVVIRISFGDGNK